MSTPAYVCTLTPELLAKAKEELNEDPETRHLEINTLRERIVRYRGLTARTDDAFLLRFLRARKFDQERAFLLLTNFYKMKKDNKDMFATTTPKSVRHMLEAGVVQVIPRCGKNGETIMVLRPGRWDAEKYPLIDVVKTVYVTLTHIVKSEETQIVGVQIIDDFGGLTWTHATQLSPSSAKLISTLVQDSFPMRLKGVHYINQPSFFNYIFTIMKPLLKEKLVKRLHFHGDKTEELQDYMVADELPEELKGNKPTEDPKVLTEILCACESEYVEDTKYGFVSMTVKDSSKKGSDAMENLPGTFKKLNVD